MSKWENKKISKWDSDKFRNSKNRTKKLKTKYFFKCSLLRKWGTEENENERLQMEF